jgi:hypothetical protein
MSFSPSPRKIVTCSTLLARIKFLKAPKGKQGISKAGGNVIILPSLY